jgi:AcrR family transcriptional regulator
MNSMDAERQRAVLDHAMLLFSREKFHEITVDKLSRASGVAEFEIIRHYQSLDNILKAVLEREMEVMAAAAHASIFRDEFYVLAGVILDQCRQRAPFLRSVLSESMWDPQVAALFRRTFVVRGRLLFAEFLGIRKQRGELRDDVDVEASAAVLFSALTGILLTHELFELDDPLLRQTCEAFLTGTARR